MINISKLSHDELIKLRDAIDIELNKKDMTSGALPDTLGKRPMIRILNVYSILWERKYGRKPSISFPMISKMFKPLLATLTEYQIGLLVAVHMNWRGSNGDSDFIEKRLTDNCHPLTWLPKAVNEYTVYITNKEGINFDDHDVVKGVLNKILL